MKEYESCESCRSTNGVFNLGTQECNSCGYYCYYGGSGKHGRGSGNWKLPSNEFVGGSIKISEKVDKICKCGNKSIFWVNNISNAHHCGMRGCRDSIARAIN